MTVLDFVIIFAASAVLGTLTYAHGRFRQMLLQSNPLSRNSRLRKVLIK